MSALDHRVDKALEALEGVADGFVDHVKLKAARRPWVFILCALVLGFILGAALV